MLKKFVFLLCLSLFLVACASSEEKSVELVNKATAYYEEGKFAEARVEAKNAIKLDPNNARAFLVLGNCAVKDQNWRGAFGAYGQAVKLDPSLIEAQLGLGRIYLLSRQFEKAEETVVAILEMDANNMDAHLLRAGVLLQTSDYVGAQRILRAVLLEHPGNTDALLGLVTSYEKKGELGEAWHTLGDAIKSNPTSATLRYKAAAMAESAGNFDEAGEHYERLMEISEEKSPVRLMMIRMYEKAGQIDKAEVALGELIAENPDNIEYQLGLAGLYLRRKKYDESLSVISRLMVSDPQNIKVELARVDILIAKASFVEAKAELQRIVESYQDHPLTTNALSKLGTLWLKDKEYRKAIDVFDAAIAKSPDPEILFFRAQARLGAQDVEGAIADLRIVRKELPDNYEARYLLARAYLAQDKGLMAVEELHDILERNADYSPSRSLLVKYYARYGQWGLAEEELMKLLGQTPDEPALLIAMGDVRRMRGDVKSAVNYYEQVLAQPEGQAPALLRLGMLAEVDKKYIQAVGYYDKVLAMHPKSAAAIERKLFALFASGNQRGLESFKTSLLRDMPESPVLHDIFGRIALADNNRLEAEKEFRKASEIAPDWSVPYQRLIGIYLANKEMDKVVEQCRSALIKNPDAFAEEFLLGQIYQMQGETAKAKGAYESVLNKKADFLPAANNLAYLYAENNSDEKSLTDALKLAQLAASKGNPEALDTLGWVYHLLGNREQSIETLHKAYEEMPENKTIAFHLATVLAKWAYTAEAKRIAEKALADGGDFPERSQMEDLLNAL